MPELIEEARLISNSVHRNAMYGVYPYKYHTGQVVQILIDHGYGGEYLIAAWLHDCIEDGSLTYNKIKKVFGITVAEIVLAVTDPSDERDRADKKAKVIKKIMNYPEAGPVKVADRIANFVMGIREKNYEKLRMYLGEQEEFSVIVNTSEDSLWESLLDCVILAEATLKGYKLEQKQKAKQKV